MRNRWIATLLGIACSLSVSLASGRLRQGKRPATRKLSTNDQAHNITKTVEICKKKEETECGIWNSVFHESAFDCEQYSFATAYDICKGLERHQYCGCADDPDLLEWVNKFLEERRTDNMMRYHGRPYPAPTREGSGFLEFALCIKDEDDEGLLCRECELWNLNYMVNVCNVTGAIEKYCGCAEPAIGEYIDAMAELERKEALKKQYEKPAALEADEIDEVKDGENDIDITSCIGSICAEVEAESGSN